jgi:hypothetical protein
VSITRISQAFLLSHIPRLCKVTESRYAMLCYGIKCSDLINVISLLKRVNILLLCNGIRSCDSGFTYCFLSLFTDNEPINRSSLLDKRGLCSSRGRLTAEEIMAVYYVHRDCVHCIMKRIKDFISAIIHTLRGMYLLQNKMLIISKLQCC